jgi:osmotically-inducible protein OsmY
MTDKELKRNIQNALDWEPSVDAAGVGVAVENGIVTLHGTVGSYSQKTTAEHVVLHVYGVKGVANDLVVQLPSALARTDGDLAQAALNTLKWHTLVPEDRIVVVVENGWVRLTGTVDWQYQKDVAGRAVRDLLGVKGVTNGIVVKPHVKTSDVREKIEAAFRRSAEIDARRISVTAHDGKVVLSGNVHSWSERVEAERAAWAAPGVTQVEDRLAIVP